MPLAIVTGGAGFIGSHMVDLLVERGYQVRVIDTLFGGRRSNLAHHPDIEIEEIDIRQLSFDAFKGATFVFHFAGIGDIVPSIERPAEYMDVNVQGTVRVLEAARYAGAKVVYAASSSCYGLADIPTKETAPICPEYPYALSKYMGEQACFHWHKVYHLPVNSIRIFNAYGTRSRTTGAYGAVIGVFMKQRLEKRPFTVVGDGTQRRDFVYATDVAEAFLKAAETKRVGEVYNLGAGNPQSVNRLVELLEGDVIYIPKRPGEPECTWADISKITSQLNWNPKISFEEGIGRILQRENDWKEAPLWDQVSIAASTKVWFEHLARSS